MFQRREGSWYLKALTVRPSPFQYHSVVGLFGLDVGEVNVKRHSRTSESIGRVDSGRRLRDPGWSHEEDVTRLR